MLVFFKQGCEMKQLKIILISVVVGVAIGMWFGVNIGRDEPFYANPFKPRSIGHDIKKMSGEALEKSGEAMEKTGKSLQDKLNK